MPEQLELLVVMSSAAITITKLLGGCYCCLLLRYGCVTIGYVCMMSCLPMMLPVDT
uniref:Uncharacterized protein n=1 Tax=Arundo donax TaxID=35708 RepID=A0A0A8Y3Y9_ARUDO